MSLLHGMLVGGNVFVDERKTTQKTDWLTKVPTPRAQQGVPNGTIPIPGDEGNSVVWLGVFHELHCANVLRKLIWFEYYSVMADLVAGRNNMRNHLGK